MDFVEPPSDLKVIIDKLAVFVARNGPQFEELTKAKQENDPRFDFLHGGQYFQYYRHKVNAELAIMNNEMSRPNFPPPPPMGNQWRNNYPSADQIKNQVEALSSQQNNFQGQISQSEMNLAAQKKAMSITQEKTIEEEIAKKEEEFMLNNGAECGIDFAEFDNILNPIIESCTKESISTGKAWIVQRATAQKPNAIIAKYLLKKVLDLKGFFNKRLYIIYLVNDTIHNCIRKGNTDLRKALSDVLVPMFCHAAIDVKKEQDLKLRKLLVIWENNNYFGKDVIEKLKNPVDSLVAHKEELREFYRDVVDRVIDSMQMSYNVYEQQHRNFVNHVSQQMEEVEKQKQVLTQQLNAMLASPMNNSRAFQSMPVDGDHFNNSDGNQQNHMHGRMNKDPRLENRYDMGYMSDHGPPMLSRPFHDSNMMPPFHQMHHHHPHHHHHQMGYSGPINNPDLNLPDLSRPPPNFGPNIPSLMSLPPPDFVQKEEIPKLPYFSLPAGLMAPLIKLEDYKYKPLKSEDIRLPPPVAPSERVHSAVKAFYAPPTHDRPRDSEGWEKLGLYEYFKAKSAAKEAKMEEIAKGEREASKSPTPVRACRSKSKSPVRRRRYKSRSKSLEKENTPKMNKPPPPKPTPSPKKAYHRRKKKSRSNSASPSSPRFRRSPTPPSFFGGNYGKLNEKLDESNKGHQMLRKMGWGGAGLGSKGQGIEAPIDGGEVRDWSDQYKGVGVKTHDPFENFRKSKGQAFVSRMKERAVERGP